MIKTGFLGIETGHITWEGLLGGSVGVAGAVATVLLAHALQARHARSAALVEAVEAYRAYLLTTNATFSLLRDSEIPAGRLSEAEVRLLIQGKELAARIRARCTRRDRLLETNTAFLADEVFNALTERQTKPVVLARMFFDAWLHGRSAVRRGRVDLITIIAEYDEQMATIRRPESGAAEKNPEPENTSPSRL